MKIFKTDQHLDILDSQLRLKVISQNSYDLNLLKASVNINANILKLKTFHDENVLECFLLFDLLFRGKSTVKSFQRKYQQSNLQIAMNLRKYQLYNFLLLLQIFYFPLFLRRNLFLKLAFDSTKNLIFNVTELNNFPFFPDVYFKWTIPLNCFINIYDINRNVSKAFIALFMYYQNTPVYLYSDKS